eukprot:1158708-Pelagomonas_calceolata.AAC.2
MAWVSLAARATVKFVPSCSSSNTGGVRPGHWGWTVSVSKAQVHWPELSTAQTKAVYMPGPLGATSVRSGLGLRGLMSSRSSEALTNSGCAESGTCGLEVDQHKRAVLKASTN